MDISIYTKTSGILTGRKNLRFPSPYLHPPLICFLISVSVCGGLWNPSSSSILKTYALKISVSLYYSYGLLNIQGLFREGGRHLPPLAFACTPWICWEFYFTCINYKNFNDTINGKLCLCENSPRFHQIASSKRSKIKISLGSMPPNPPFATWIHTCSPP